MGAVAAYGLADLELETGEGMRRSFVGDDCGFAVDKVLVVAVGFAFVHGRKTFGGSGSFAAVVDVAAVVGYRPVVAAADGGSVVVVEVLIAVVEHRRDVAALLGFGL